MGLLIVFTTMCFVLKICVPVKGGYFVQVRLHGYSNPTGQCGHSDNCHTGKLHCCDASYNTEDCSNNPCDSYFTYCLRPFGEAQLTTLRCSSGQITSHANPNDGYLDFSQSEVLGLDNPLRLPGQGVYNGVQLYIEIGDSDSGSDEVVDILLVNLNQTVAESQRQSHTGIYNLITMDLTITVLCDENFGGSDCTQCVPGFIGSNCEVNIDECLSNPCGEGGQCMDGVNSFQCICDPGFTGEFCSESESISVTTISSNGSRLLAGALGGGISGALLLLIIILLLTTSCTIALCWSRKAKMKNHCDKPQHEQIYEEIDDQLNNEGNEAYGSTVHCIPTGDNVAYGQTTLKISTEDNVAYDQIM